MTSSIERGGEVLLIAAPGQSNDGFNGGNGYSGGGAGTASENIVGQDAPFRAEVVSAVGIAAFDVIYVQASVAGVIILIGAVLIYLFVAMQRRTVEFLIATDGEMKKVNWSTRKEVQGSTMVVVIASFLLAMIIFVIDYGFGAFFKLIGVLQG